MQPEFTPKDIAEAERLHARLQLLPRFRMQTTAGRMALNLMLWGVEAGPTVAHWASGAKPELRDVTVDDQAFGLRIFRPPGESGGVIAHLHGGGWTIGNARMADGGNAALAERLGVTVVAIDYRLATFRPIREVIANCAAALGWIAGPGLAELGGGPVAIKASSAGSHLAAAALLRLRDGGRVPVVIRGAVLLYGLYDFAGTAMVRTGGDDVVILHAPTVRRVLEKLTPGMSDAERRMGWLSPVYADLAGMPPALLVVGERDMLLEDNRRMAAAWRGGENGVELLTVPASGHAFDHFNTSVARKAEAAVDDWLRRRLNL